jgi:hypothetical protein
VAFPVTGTLDSFDRVDSATLGANWTADIWGFGWASLDIVSNAADSNSAAESNWWNGTTFGPDVEVTTTIKSSFLDVDDGGGGWTPTDASLFARIASPGTAGIDGYYIDFFGGPNGGYTAWIYRLDNRVSTILGAAYTGFSIDAGDKFGFSVVGSTLTFYRKPAAGSWAQVSTTRTDATYSAAGYIGLLGASAGVGVDAEFDDFGGGTITAAVSTDVMLPMGMLGTSRV